MMNLDQLQLLDAIVRYGSFKAAADKLYRSQPAVSVSIRKLEEDLGFELFSRENYRPSLTQKGRIFHQKTKQLLLNFAQLERLGHELSISEEPEIIMAIDSLFPLPTILNILNQFERNYPYTRLNLSIEHVGGALDRLLLGKAHLAIAADALSPEQPLESLLLMPMPMFNVIAAGHPLAQLPGPISDEELANLVQVVVKDSGSNPDAHSYNLLPGGRQWAVTDPHTKKEIILSGLGWGALPQHLVQVELDRGQLKILERGSPPLVAMMKVLRRTDQPIGPVSNQLWEDFKLSFKN